MIDTKITAVQPGTGRWTELVSEAKAKDAARNWFLGDAALEIAPMGGNNNGTDDVEVNLRRYADEIGIEYNSLRLYRQVATAWPSANRVADTCWKVHSMLMGRQELIRPGMTVTQAHAAMGQSIAGRTGPKSSPRERAEQVRGALADPAVLGELRRIQNEDPVDAEVRIIAGGGRIPSLGEVNAKRRDAALDAALGALADERQGRSLGDSITDLEAILATMQRFSPVGEETPEAERLRKCSLGLLDLISGKVRP